MNDPASTMNTLTLVARIAGSSADLGAFLSVCLYVVLMQGLLWSIARHSADLEWWRTVAFCAAAGLSTAFGLGLGGIEGIVTAALLGFPCAWVMLGWVFELETWQRSVMTAVGPVAAAGSLWAGFQLKKIILTWILS